MNQVDKKYIILGSLCALLLMLVVGYAVFSTVLNIKGTSNISSNWDVKITGIELLSSKGATDNEGSPSYDNTNGLSATFNTSFTTPGDYATYKIEITNNGSLDAKLTNITMPENTNNDILFYLNKNQNNEDITESLKQNDTLFKAGETGNVGYVYVTVLYRDYENQTSPTTENKSANMTITFDFEEADKAVKPTPQPKTVYAFHTDTKTIGTSTLTESDYVTDYTQIYNESTSPAFLKYDIDEEGVIQNAYACMKYFFIDEPVCLQGGSTDYYASNRAILEGLQSTFTANSGSCSLGDNMSSCGISNYSFRRNSANLDGKVSAEAENGHCEMSLDGCGYCNIYTDGSAYCGP